MKGLVIKTTGKDYTVKTVNGEIIKSFLKGNFRIKGIKSTNPIVVGDLVDLSKDSGEWVINNLCERKNSITRKSVNLSKQTHIIAANIDQAILMQDNVYYLAVRDGATYDALVTGFGGTKGGGTKKVLKANGRNGSEAIILESGLDTGEIAATAANRNTYILSTGLTDAALAVAVDTRFISTVLGPSGNDKFANIAGTGESDASFKLIPVQPSKNDRTKRYYSQAGIRTVANNVFYRTGDTKADTATSVIAGPRASATAIGFDHRTLSTEAFSRHGKTGQTISGASGTYKYIDTTVYVYAATGIVHQIPLRIIQKE